MPDLVSLLSDPNYTNANPATKQAIFDKFSQQDQNYAGANPATQSAIRSKWGVGTMDDLKAASLKTGFRNVDVASNMMGQDLTQRPTFNPIAERERLQANATAAEGLAERQAHPVGAQAWQHIRPMAERDLPVLGATVGGVIGGTVGSPVAAPVAAGLGYGLAKSGIRAIDSSLGTPSPLMSEQMVDRIPATYGSEVLSALGDVSTGAGFEMGGQLLGKGMARAAGKTVDFVRRLKGDFEELGPTAIRAGKILREAAGAGGYEIDDTLQALGSVDQAKRVLAKYNTDPTSVSSKEVAAALKYIGQNENATTRQLLAGQNSPTLQAVLRGSETSTPGAIETTLANRARQEAGTIRSLEEVAGSTNPTEAMAAEKLTRTNLNAQTGPIREAALNRANMGEQVAISEARLAEQQAQQLQNEATARLHGELSAQTAGSPTAQPISQNLAASSANLTNEAGVLQAQARNNSQIAESLRRQGISPLTPEAVTQQIMAKIDPLEHPELAASTQLKSALEGMVNEIGQYIKPSGVIDAKAIYALRQNGIDNFLNGLQLDPTAKQKLHAKILAEVKPIFDDAIKTAGGGEMWEKYLTTHAAGEKAISQQGLTAELLNMFKSRGAGGEKNKMGEFMDIVQGKKPDLVRESLGREFDIKQGLPDKTVKRLDEAARLHLQNLKIEGDATEGQQAATQLLSENLHRIWRFPGMLSRTVMLSNEGLAYIEQKLGKDVMAQLVRAAQDPTHARNLMEALPSVDRIRVLSILDNPHTWKNMLAPESFAARIPGAMVEKKTQSKFNEVF